MDNATPDTVVLEHATASQTRHHSAATSRGAAGPAAATLEVAVIDGRTLLRECFDLSLRSRAPDVHVRHFASVSDFLAATATSAVDVALLGLDWGRSRASDHLGQVAALRAADPGLGIIVMADIEDIENITALFEAGARGYIASSDHIDIAVQAIHLVQVGGTYISAEVVMLSSRIAKQAVTTSEREPSLDLTPKQLTIADALRRGKANKSIAYELNMCESTVKVHVRSIMKKLKARNRTEAAYMINRVLGNDDGPTVRK